MTADGFNSEFESTALRPVPPPAGNPDGLPYPTHAGELRVGGHVLRVYQLNTGERVIDAGDVAAFFAPPLADEQEGE